MLFELRRDVGGTTTFSSGLVGCAATLGHTLFAHTKAMIVGYEEEEAKE
jgi:hypothetical protein